MSANRKVTRVYFREAAYVGSTAVESVPPVEVRSSPKALEWSCEELPSGDVLVTHRTMVKGNNGALRHVDCRSRIPAANIRSIGYEEEDVVALKVAGAAK